MDTFELREVSFRYPDSPKKALDGVNLTLRRGDFLVLCGESGSGKSTLLRQLKTVLAPHGAREGTVLFEGVPLEDVDGRTQSARIGFVGQSPESQIVTDKVWHELAFGLESLGLDNGVIRRRVAETASFFGIQSCFRQSVASLSGGQKQLLLLASVMAMQPAVLLLDEPTAQLDPIAAADFLAALARLNREQGTTILLTEHRLNEALPLANRAAVLSGGRLLCAGTAHQVGAALRARGHRMFRAMPVPMRIWAAVENDAPCPVTVRDGRDWLENYAAAHPLGDVPPIITHTYPDEPLLEAHGLFYRYAQDAPEAVQELSLALHAGEFMALLGGNGTGKSTALALLAGLLTPQRGEVVRRAVAALLPQDPRTLFVKKTVRADLLEAAGPAAEADAARMAALCRLEELMDRHPYDLSGGEQQRLALAKVLLTGPRVLLLDEPTKGLDGAVKETLAEILARLLQSGAAVLMVSHDVEFCARYAHRCALLFDGAVAAADETRAFFAGNAYYTTAASRMAREKLPQAVTAEDVVAACGGALPAQPPLPEAPVRLPAPRAGTADWTPAKLPAWRKLLAALSGLTALPLFFQVLRVTDLSALVGPGGLSARAAVQLGIDFALLLALAVFALAIGRRSPPMREISPERPVARRAVLAAAVTVALIPLTLWVGVWFWNGRKYYFIALLVLLECLLPFFLVFEGRKPQARELTLIAALCALGVAGRTAFFMLPNFNPVMALTVAVGAALGGETGFLTGAMTMLLSNFLFGQGPWTPWQMFAMGCIGLLAGAVFRRGRLRPSRLSLSVFGALSALLVYGGIMNPAAALIELGTLTRETLLVYYVTGLPVDLVHAGATALFLWLAGEPMLEKLRRVRTKYGLM